MELIHKSSAQSWITTLRYQSERFAQMAIKYAADGQYTLAAEAHAKHEGIEWSIQISQKCLDAFIEAKFVSEAELKEYNRVMHNSIVATCNS